MFYNMIIKNINLQYYYALGLRLTTSVGLATIYCWLNE